MGFTAYEKNYGFHEEELNQQAILVTNSSARDWEQHELVYVDGYFGEVLNPEGIESADSGYISIIPWRIVRTEQVAAANLMAGDFIAGHILYFIPQTDGAAGALVDQNDPGAPAVAIGVIQSADTANAWVAFMPFVQPVGLIKFSTEDARLDVLEDAVDLLNDAVTEAGSVLHSIKNEAAGADYDNATSGLAATSIQDAIDEIDGDLDDVEADVAALKTKELLVKEVAITANASGGLDFSMATLGLAVGDEVVNIWVIGTANSGGATLKVSHGNAGADISSAMACASVGAFAHSASVVGGVLTADGITVTANGANDRGRIFMIYLKA